MRGRDCSLLDLLKGNEKQLVVPVYQRNYDWEKENCRRLFDDLMALSKEGKREAHFLGNIVTCESVGNPNARLIIDGQQRLITVSLLLLAIYDLLIDQRDELFSEKRGLMNDIYHLLVCQVRGTISHPRKNVVPYRLYLSDFDQDAYEELFQDSRSYKGNSKIIANYEFFRGKVEESISKQEITIGNLFDNIHKLVVINVELDANDDPQLVFESLNSTGVALSAGDKIRNFILMDFDLDTQKRYYNAYWKEIEKNTQDGTEKNIDDFVYNYLRAKTCKLGNQKRIYEEFKEYKNAEGKDVETLLKDMLKYADKYKILLGGKLIDAQWLGANVISKNDSKLVQEKIIDCIFRLNWLETFVVRPFLMEVLCLLQDGQLELQDALEVFQIVESYIYRRKICDKPSNVLNKLFVELHRNIKEIDGTTSNYVNKFKECICKLSGRAAFPNDVEFKDAFGKREIYVMQRHICNYTLERLECFGVKDAPRDYYDRFKEGKITIEHIMPQKLTPEWNRELGANNQRIHTEWLNRIANLTMTGYNSELSNAPFREKKAIYKVGRVKLNEEIARQNKWGEKQLKKRSSALAAKALEIWDKPNVSLDRVSLGDTKVLFKGLQIEGYIYKGDKEQKVSSWRHMLEEMVKLQILNLSRGGDFIKSLKSNSSENSWMRFFNEKEDGLIKGKEIVSGLFYETNTDTKKKIRILRGLFEYFKLNPNDLVFVLKK